MKSNTIYLVTVILSVIFIAIFALCLLLIKPKSKYKDDSADAENISPEKRYSHRNNNKRKKQSNKYKSNDVNYYNDYQNHPSDYQNEEKNSNYNSEPKSKPISSASFSEGCVVYHNKYRSKHKQTNDVSNSQRLTVSAQRKVELMARTDDFNHTPDLEDGENLWYLKISRRSDEIFASLDCYRPSKAWYDEERTYNYRSPTQSSGVVGHFTQMVWRSTLQMGCAKSHSRQTNKIYVVCHYSPSGNIEEEYSQNVFPKIQ